MKINKIQKIKNNPFLNKLILVKIRQWLLINNNQITKCLIFIIVINYRLVKRVINNYIITKIIASNENQLTSFNINVKY
jgi:hypothetical protein